MAVAPQDGGFDVGWPEGDDELFDLGWKVSDCLVVRGWCVVQVPKEEEVRKRALAKAERQSFGRHKAQLLPDFLGRGGAGKATVIDPLDVSDVEAVSSRLGDGHTDDPIQQFDADLSSVFLALAPITFDSLGFNCAGRTDPLSWLPFASSRERSDLEPDQLTDEDVEDGVVERHLRFLKRRKLCLLYLVDTEGGRVQLFAREGPYKEQPVEIPAAAGRLVVFRCDQLGFRYEPSGQHLTLLSWILDEPPRMQLSDVQGDAQSKDDFYGIVKGPGAPYHESARIIGIACYTGGNVYDLHSAMSMYVSGTDGGVKVPATRFDTEIYFSKDGQNDHISGMNSYQIHGGMCPDDVVMGFDNRFFGISEDESSIMTPNQRKVLEVGYEALQSCGHTKESVKNAPIMVYMGDCGTEWETQLLTFRYAGTFADGTKLELKEKTVQSLDWISASNMASIGSRLSYSLGLRGPVFFCDTACSSGLTAFNTAMYSLRRSSTARSLDSHVSGALAGGVNQITDPIIYIGNCSQHMLSVRGRCFTFDVSGDGYGRGEGTSLGYTVFGNDEKHIDMQHGVAIGTKVNQDGRSASMTAPNGPSQQMCIKASLREAQVDPHDITTSECHGTGTSLGDPIEVGSLRGVQETDQRDNALLCTSSKSNIGHLEADAGVTGLFKCVLMGKYAVAPPNCHLRTLNPHLDVTGWPAVFEADICDYSANSGIAGVSSFGVSGTNSHAEVWGKCIAGPNSTARQASYDPDKLYQIRVLCPVTLGPIDYLTGEPISTRAALDSDGQPVRVKADVLRDELASYDVSSYAYEGGYRFRAGELPDTSEELPDGYALYVCGSWSGWKAMEEMQLEDDGSYLATFVLGETRCEAFFLCLNESLDLRIYPAADKASPRIWIEGPDDKGEGLRWIIDGRDDQVPAGTVYQIRFRWGEDRKRIEWEEVDAKFAEVAAPTERKYHVSGSWTSWIPQEMLKDPEEGSAWECVVRMGPLGQEQFHFLRDADPRQAIYPSSPQASDPQVPVRGPDDLGKGKSWLIRGRADDIFRLRLEVLDGHITVAVKSDKYGERVFASRDGWERHDYCLAASWNDWRCETLVMEPDSPGVFRYHGTLGTAFSDSANAFVEEFKIVVDEDFGQAFYPDLPAAGSGESITRGPDGDGRDRSWLIKGPRPGAGFEIVLDLRAVDRRKVVTWKWDDLKALTVGGEFELEALPPP